MSSHGIVDGTLEERLILHSLTIATSSKFHPQSAQLQLASHMTNYSPHSQPAALLKSLNPPPNRTPPSTSAKHQPITPHDSKSPPQQLLSESSPPTFPKPVRNTSRIQITLQKKQEALSIFGANLYGSFSTPSVNPATKNPCNGNSISKHFEFSKAAVSSWRKSSNIILSVDTKQL